MNLLSYDEIVRVLALGIISGSALIIGFIISYFGNKTYIEFLQKFIYKLELLLEERSGRIHSDIDRDVP